jgi:hypothetical protein
MSVLGSRASSREVDGRVEQSITGTKYGHAPAGRATIGGRKTAFWHWVLATRHSGHGRVGERYAVGDFVGPALFAWARQGISTLILLVSLLVRAQLNARVALEPLVPRPCLLGHLGPCQPPWC